MLVIKRRRGERFRIGKNVTVSIVDLRSGDVSIGIEAPKCINIWRTEISSQPGGAEVSDPLYDFCLRFSKVTTWQQFAEVTREWNDYRNASGENNV